MVRKTSMLSENVMALGTLTQVNLREAWPHEARSFTPWLGQHLSELSEKIGMPLELEGVEVMVDTFSADILARNPEDDTLVLIENQLEGSDHSHLGQIMTYLAGLDARTVIWVAAGFRDAHLSALRWLNENTAEGLSFFAVQVKAVRIGDSAIAPVFEVLEKPNAWEKKLAHTREKMEVSELGLKRKKFWDYFLGRFPQEAVSGEALPLSSRWCTLGGGEVIVSYYLSRKEVGLFVRGGRGVAPEDVGELLQPAAHDIETALNVAIGDIDRGKLFLSKLPCNTDDEGNWQVAADWLAARLSDYREAIEQHAG